MIVGLDIGGTKCAVAVYRDGKVVEILRIPTGAFAPTFARLVAGVRKLAAGQPVKAGISCGGPLDADAGLILNPPNLDASWHGAAICQLVEEHIGGPARLMNDANACALAEWRFGAGRGAKHLVFLTSGTGMGAGLILNGQLYEGATGDAGEVGHVRLHPDGPTGYGKAGSVEGSCSGGGIARLARLILQRPGWAGSFLQSVSPLTMKAVTEAARSGDPAAIEILREAGGRLGEMLAVLLDLFNPERIVLGGFYPLSRDLLEPALREALNREALPQAVAASRILPAELGETIGSHGAIAAALQAFGLLENAAARQHAVQGAGYFPEKQRQRPS